MAEAESSWQGTEAGEGGLALGRKLFTIAKQDYTQKYVIHIPSFLFPIVDHNERGERGENKMSEEWKKRN
jgi:hypothetical protein